LVKVLPKNRKPLINAAIAVPKGPTISVSDGSKAQNRTYQDLLKTPNDEFNFEQLAHSEIVKVSIDGNSESFLPSAMYRGVSFSPDGNYVMVSKIKRPFSYLVTYSRFPSESIIYSTNGDKIKTVVEVPLDEVRPKGFMSTRTGKRNMSWRGDKPSTLFWAYNRALTPFGFQSEERSYWEAPEIYYNMSPFMHADKIKTPLLLIHGVADNNSGTYPLQSERYFNALKGLGATVRLVMLPKESLVIEQKNQSCTCFGNKTNG
jgi:hypothetical protein